MNMIKIALCASVILSLARASALGDGLDAYGNPNFNAISISSGLTAGSGAFTIVGNSTYSVTTSSGIRVSAGPVVAPGGFVGPVYGSIVGGSVTSGVAESVNGSMVGTGASGAALGVNPSSVPVYQAGAYPAASGAAITSLAPSNHSSGTFPAGVYLAASGVTAGQYGGAASVPSLTITSSGTVAYASSTAITPAAIGAQASGASAGGDLTGTYPSPALASAGTAGTYGSGTVSPTITTDSKGRVVAMSSNTITAAGIGAAAQGAAVTFSSITDSGNALVGGTMTVQGNALSIGGAVINGDSSASITLPGSSVTIRGNVGISTGNGITLGAGSSTGTPCGMFFFASSATVVSTFTTSSAWVNLATATIPANILANSGEGFDVVCVFQNTSVGTFTTPYEGVNWNGQNSVTAALSPGYEAVTTAGVWIETLVHMVYIAGIGIYADNGYGHNSGAGGGAPIAINGKNMACNNYYPWPFSPSSSYTIGCGAQNAGGGAINFIQMRVAKSCR